MASSKHEDRAHGRLERDVGWTGLVLTQHGGDRQVGGLVHFVILDVDAWHSEFLGRGARVAEAPNADLGFRNMTIMDPDGNQMPFMEPSNDD